MFNEKYSVIETTINGKVLQILPLVFNRARLCIGVTDSSFYNDVW